MLALACLSAAAASRFVIQPWDGFSPEPVNVYVAVVMKSANRKPRAKKNDENGKRTPKANKPKSANA